MPNEEKNKSVIRDVTKGIASLLTGTGASAIVGRITAPAVAELSTKSLFWKVSSRMGVIGISMSVSVSASKHVNHYIDSVFDAIESAKDIDPIG